MLKQALLIASFISFSISYAQQMPQEFKVGAIPNPERFNQMTRREIRLDSLKQKHQQEQLKRMEDGSAFIDGVPEETKQQMIEYEKIRGQRYKDNRSRYFMDEYVNGKKDNEAFEGIDTLTTECSCYLSGDTIKVKMGIWVFGGFQFFINIYKNSFNSSYWVDNHEQLIYKTYLTDKSLTDNISVENAEQELILRKNPEYKLGEQLPGFLRFKTKDYYRTRDYDRLTAKDTYDADKMNTIHMAGSLYFTCTIRKKTMEDE